MPRIRTIPNLLIFDGDGIKYKTTDVIASAHGAPLPRRPCPMCWNAPCDPATGGACNTCMQVPRFT